jgi:hypothetical protein
VHVWHAVIAPLTLQVGAADSDPESLAGVEPSSPVGASGDEDAPSSLA